MEETRVLAGILQRELYELEVLKSNLRSPKLPSSCFPRHEPNLARRPKNSSCSNLNPNPNSYWKAHEFVVQGQMEENVAYIKKKQFTNQHRAEIKLRQAKAYSRLKLPYPNPNP